MLASEGFEYGLLQIVHWNLLEVSLEDGHVCDDFVPLQRKERKVSMHSEYKKKTAKPSVNTPLGYKNDETATPLHTYHHPGPLLRVHSHCARECDYA